VNDDVVIGFLRARGRAQPPADLVSRVMAGVDEAPVQRSRFAAFMPAAAAAGAIAIVAILAVLISQGIEVGPQPTPTTDAVPSPASADELRAAVESGLDALREAPGVEGVSTASVLGELSGATWFTWRPNGDQVVVARTDVDVAQTAWWMQPGGQPPARGENVTTMIHVLIGDRAYVSEADAWVEQSRADVPGVAALATGLLDGDPTLVGGFLGIGAADVTVRRTADGGAVWSVSAPDRGGVATAEWTIGPDGSLASYSSEVIGATPTPEDSSFVTSQRMDFTPISDAGQIEPPDTQAPPDPASLGLPDGFPLGTDASSAVDYAAYVEAALDALEAYHWNTAAIDWEAARAAALDGLPDDPTAGQAHQRIQAAIGTFDAFNTVFVRPEDVPPAGEGPAQDRPAPTGERRGDVGYLHLPASNAGGPEDVLAYLQDGWAAMQSIESSVPACGWIVDVRETAFGAYPPLFGVVGGLLGEGRVITYDSALGDWWVDVSDDGTLLIGGEERTADVLDSPAVASATAEDERENAEFAAMLASAAPHLPADPDAPVVVLTASTTTAAGEQLVVGFRGRPNTRVIGGVTAGNPHGQMSLEMVDGARLRFPVSTVVDRDGNVYDGNLEPDEHVVVGGSQGPDPATEAATEWLESTDACS
jgi:carboxyl-terminal processing protease